MISDELRRKVARLAAHRLEQKRQGIAVAPVILAVRKELIPDRPQTSRFHFADVLTDRQKQRQA